MQLAQPRKHRKRRLGQWERKRQQLRRGMNSCDRRWCVVQLQEINISEKKLVRSPRAFHDPFQEPSD
ncbi:hypothetical protein ANANG_G00053640 [Anguilla anguilla]|uniref:Uncharacterized protein n=1 Tax=Anguilla anguilla TaxID=7936 RepID=A0A9D3MMJ6_ANGAN|nr:hypothetical protein ANANG_G00053640 [Anguilla anguilla]